MLVDLSPLRHYPAYRNLWFGYLASMVGSQLTLVAVPYQIYRQTHSTLQVGLVSLAQLGALLIGSLCGGVVADHFDRRRLLGASQVLLALTSVGLGLNALGGRGSLWAIYVCSSAAAAVSGVGGPTRTALVVHLVPTEALVSANALWQVQFQIGTVVGPSLAGLLIAHVGLSVVYLTDAVTYAATIISVLLIPRAGVGSGRAGLSLRALADGFVYLRSQPVLQGVFLIDLNAMIFGMPRALFPALALGRFHGGASTLGLLYAAPGAGALLGALLTGWATSIRRQGLAVMLAVALWGVAVTGFGLAPLLWLALFFLVIAGASDVVSALFRSTMLQVEAPNELSGRVQAVQFAVVTGGPRLGDVEAAGVASGFGVDASIISGGLACLVGVALLAWRIPSFLHYTPGSTRADSGRPAVSSGAGLEPPLVGPAAPPEPAEA